MKIKELLGCFMIMLFSLALSSNLTAQINYPPLVDNAVALSLVQNELPVIQNQLDQAFQNVPKEQGSINYDLFTRKLELYTLTHESLVMGRATDQSVTDAFNAVLVKHGAVQSANAPTTYTSSASASTGQGTQGNNSIYGDDQLSELVNLLSL